MKPFATAMLFLALAGCAAPGPGGRAPALEPPPARAGDPLSRDDALATIRRARDSEAAIEALDHQRFAFALDARTLEWFADQDGVASDVVDYLRKRSRVSWDNLRGDVDPDSPGENEYVDPRRAYGEDFAGSDHREAHRSLRSRSPYTVARGRTSWERALSGDQ